MYLSVCLCLCVSVCLSVFIWLCAFLSVLINAWVANKGKIEWLQKHVIQWLQTNVWLNRELYWLAGCVAGWLTDWLTEQRQEVWKKEWRKRILNEDRIVVCHYFTLHSHPFPPSLSPTIHLLHTTFSSFVHCWLSAYPICHRYICQLASSSVILHSSFRLQPFLSYITLSYNTVKRPSTEFWKQSQTFSLLLCCSLPYSSPELWTLVALGVWIL